MILYTVMPKDLIFPADETAFQNQKIVEFDGVPVLVQLMGDHYQIIRNLSSDPAHFLYDKWAPGTKIPLS
ncbi:YlzJ-like family protein [Bacillaceae bacterium Marseille-Q3522]|nr:YlzJ-like family protein [Bacillaceae bacterium Marseille-Q3522]